MVGVQTKFNYAWVCIRFHGPFLLPAVIPSHAKKTHKCTKSC